MHIIQTLRKIQKKDYYRGYLDLLEHLTIVNKEQISYKKFNHFIKNLNRYHLIYVLEDKSIKKVVATGTLLIEPKLIRGCGLVGHIEDIVVDKEYRHKHYGTTIVRALTQYAKKFGCYKVILDCENDVEKFYEKCDLKNKSSQMAQYLT